MRYFLFYLNIIFSVSAFGVDLEKYQDHESFFVKSSLHRANQWSPDFIEKVKTDLDLNKLLYRVTQFRAQIDSFFEQQFTNSIDDEDFSKLEKIEKYLCLKLDELEKETDFKDDQLKIGSIIKPERLGEDNSESNPVEWIIDRWGKQTWKQAVLGGLFYPAAIPGFADISTDNYYLPKVFYRLALAARYGVIPAWKHLEAIAEYYADDEIQERIQLQKLASRKFDEYEPENDSLFHRGYIARIESNDEKAKDLYIKDIKEKGLSSDIRSFLEAGRLTGNKEYIEKALEKGIADALVCLVRLELTDEKSLDKLRSSIQKAELQFSQDGEVNLIIYQGLLEVQNILQRREDLASKINLSVFENLKTHEETRKTLKHPDFYVQESYKHNKEEAKKVLKLAGPVVAYSRLIQLASSAAERRKMAQERSSFLEKQFNILFKLSQLNN